MTETEKETWLHTNEIEQFVGALEFAAELLPSAINDPSYWKWEIVALHNALQGAFVCALSGADTAGISFLNKKSGEKMWHWLEVTSRSQPEVPPPSERLAEILVLFERVKNPIYLENPLPSDERADSDVKMLNDLRNDFIHFVPRSWSVELSGMPRIANTVCRAIRYLAVEFPTFSHHFRRDEAARIKAGLLRLDAIR